MQTINATFTGGVFKPIQPYHLPEHAQVRITIEVLNAENTKAESIAALDALRRLARVYEEPHMTRDELHERR